MCIRLHRRPDGKVITKDCPKGLRAQRRRLAKFAGSIFAAFLGLFSSGYAQSFYPETSAGTRIETFVDVPMVKGRVRDPMGAVVPGAEVTITTASGNTISGKTDSKGRFSLIGLAMLNGPNSIRISSSGFANFYDEFTVGRREAIDYPVAMWLGATVGVIEVISAPGIDTSKSDITTKIRVQD